MLACECQDGVPDGFQFSTGSYAPRPVRKNF
jgi:hypothetical protein